MSLYLYEAMDRLSMAASQVSDILGEPHESEMPKEAVKAYHKAIEQLGIAYQLTAAKWHDENGR